MVFCQKARSDDFNTMVKKCDIFGLQETYLEEQDSIHFSDYENFRSERKKKEKASRNSGGVLLLFKKVILPSLEKQQSANKHFIWVKMKKDFFKLEIDIVYVVLISHQEIQIILLKGTMTFWIF